MYAGHFIEVISNPYSTFSKCHHFTSEKALSQSIYLWWLTPAPVFYLASHLTNTVQRRHIVMRENFRYMLLITTKIEVVLYTLISLAFWLLSGMGERNGHWARDSIHSLSHLRRSPFWVRGLLLIVVTCELFYYYTLLESCFEVYQNLDNISLANVKNVNIPHQKEKDYKKERKTKFGMWEAMCPLPL